MVYFEDFSHGASGKEHSYQSRLDKRDVASITGSGRSPKGRHGNSLQYFWSGRIQIDRGAWRTAVHSIAKSQT